MKSTKVAISSLFLIAIALAVFAIFYPAPTYDEVLEEHQSTRYDEELSEVIVEEKDEILYRPSVGLYVISAPIDWFVDERDSDVLSVVKISEENGAEELELYIGRATTETGVPLSLEAWTNQRLLEAEELSQCELAILGNLAVDCYIATIDGEEYRMYFGELDTLRHLQVMHKENSDYELDYRSILQSLVVNPDDKLKKEATEIL